MSRFLGNNSILYVFYSGNGPKASGGDYCIQSNIVFSDEIPASQDMPTNTTDITYVGDNATYSVPMVTSEDANSPNVTVTAFWAWPNNTETDFKCKWTLTSGTPSGCENISGAFASNIQLDLLIPIQRQVYPALLTWDLVSPVMRLTLCRLVLGW